MKSLTLHNTFTKELPGDENTSNSRRQVYKASYSYAEPLNPSNPSMVIASKDLGKSLDLDDMASEEFLHLMTGKKLAAKSTPYAMCYGGHQFGHWAGQLGDGRAINLGEVNHDGKSWVLQLKGAGPTPYSRGADGRAVLRSSVREFLCSESMFYLGVSTTRALSLALTGDKVLRDVLYDGNPIYEKGAIVCRVSESFIRIGNFELLSARKDLDSLKILADFTIRHFYPNLKGQGKDLYLSFFRAVAARTASMIIDWQRVGFVHGVMNTDNMSILGQTIDYGPYGWLENYDEEWTPNTTDQEHRRYRFGNQGSVALWNLTQLANALYPLIEDVPALEKSLDEYRTNYLKDYHKMLNTKIGLTKMKGNDEKLNKDLHDLMIHTQTDMTIFYRQLSLFEVDKPSEHLRLVKDACYIGDVVFNENKEAWLNWLVRYAYRLTEESKQEDERRANMNGVNPKYVLRNYMAQLAIEDADKENYDLIHELHELLKNPYDEQPEMQKWFAMRPSWALNKVGCSQLSCSS